MSRWFRSLDERLTAETVRTGIAARVYFDRSLMQWVGTLDGMSGRIVGYSEREIKQALLPMLGVAPDKPADSR